jgi:hypothetical protein
MLQSNDLYYKLYLFFIISVSIILWSSAMVTRAYIYIYLGPIANVSKTEVEINIEINRVDMNVKLSSF